MAGVKISALLTGSPAAALSDSDGFEVVQGSDTKGATASQILAYVNASGNTQTVATLAALKALTTRPEAVIVKTGQAAGEWQWALGDSTTADDALVVEPTSGTAGRYKRIFDGPINALWFGVSNAGVDSTTELQAAAAAACALSSDVTGRGATLYLPAGNYLTSGLVLINADRVSVVGDGPGATLWFNVQTGSDTLQFKRDDDTFIQNCTLEGIRFYSDAVSPGTKCHVRFSNAGYAYVNNVQAEGKFDNFVFEGGLSCEITNIVGKSGVSWIARQTGSSILRLKKFDTQPATGHQFTNFNFQSDGANAHLDNAVVIESNDGCQFTNGHIGFAGQSALRIVPASGSVKTVAIVFANVYFDGYFDVAGVNGIVIENPNSNSGDFGIFEFTGCRVIGAFSGDPVFINSNASSLTNVVWNGGSIGGSTTATYLARISGGTGVYFNGVQFYNTVSGPTTGLAFDNAVARGGANGCSFVNSGLSAIATGVLIAGTTDYIEVDGCNFEAITTRVSVTSSGANNVVGVNTPDSWTAFTPTITAAVGTFTSVAAAGRYKQTGKTVEFTVVITITTNGTAATAIQVPLPVTAKGTTSFAAANMSTSMGLTSLTNSFDALTRAFIVNDDGTYPGADSTLISLSGVYEAA